MKNAEDALRDEPFLVISGDALTDMDLTELVQFHKDNGALVTVGLTRVPNPLEFGIVIADEDGRIQRFLEKPTWGQVFSDTVNTGLYVMEPEVLAEVPPGEVGGLVGATCSRSCWSAAPRCTATSPTSYWEDVGTHESYLKAQADVLARRVRDGHRRVRGLARRLGRRGRRGRPGRGAHRPARASATTPRSRPARTLREYTVIGSNVVVKEGAFLHRAVVHNNVYVGQGVTLRGCVIGKNTDVMRLARIEEGAVVGDECVIEPEAYMSAGVKVYPFKTIEAGAVVNTSVIWESRGQRTLFGPRGVSGLVNVEVTPELAVRLASAYATTLRKGTTVTTSRDVSRAGADAQASRAERAQRQRDQRGGPGGPAAARWPGSRPRGDQYSGGIALRTTPGDPQSVDIIFLDDRGAELSQARPAQAGAGLLPAGVPARVPRRDRGAQPTRPGWSSRTPTSCCAAWT